MHEDSAGNGPVQADTRRLAEALCRIAARLGPTERGLAGFLAGLWTRSLRFEAADPGWPDRDRFVVSDGSLSPLLYAALHLAGVDGMEGDVLGRFGRLHSAASPSPLPALHPAIEAPAGLPGQGLAAAVGIALGERVMASRFGRSLVDHRTWVLASAADLSAGLGQEVASIAGQLRLDRLAVVFAEPGSGAREDAGPDAASVRDKEEIELLRRFSACGWSVRSLDGEDAGAVGSSLAAVDRARRPILIACRPSRVATADDAAIEAVPEETARPAWRAAGTRGAVARRAWLRRLARHGKQPEFERSLTGRLPPSWHEVLAATARSAPRDESPEAATFRALHALAPVGRSLVFLSSSRTEAMFSGLPALGPASFAGRHLACGAQEHGMATLANGLSLHGGILPVLALPAIAADRIRPALRMAALTGRKMVLLLTDDGLSAASEGAAFQPVEQLAGLRAMPGLFVFRPCCAVEAIECLELALRRADGPSVIVLGRELARTGRAASGANRARQGGHVAAEGARRDVTLIASGAEVELALGARALLLRDGIEAAVVSLPCWELFGRQDRDWRETVLGEAPRVGVEAAGGFGWERWLGPEGRFVGLDGFGASGEAEELRAHLGLTRETLVATARDAVLARRSGVRGGTPAASSIRQSQ